VKGKLPVILLLIPLVAGYLLAPISSAFSFLGTASALWLLNLIFAVYWFRVGSYFARLPVRRLSSYLLGILPTLIGLLLFVYEFYLAKTRSFLLAGLPQVYVSYLVTWGASIIKAIPTRGATINGSDVVVAAYLLMGLIYSAGYLWGVKKRDLGLHSGI
jgi:hypothetical protein